MSVPDDASAPSGSDARPRGWRTRRTAIIVLVAVQLGLAALALAVWIWTPDAPALPPETSATAPLAGSGATYESGLPLARQQAAAWLPEAVLLNASMQVDWPWAVPEGETEELPGTGWLTYAFVAPWQPPGRPPGAASLGIVIERLSGVIVSQESDGWEIAPEFRPPPPPAALDSTAATLRAEAAGGTAYRRACPAQRHVSRTFPIAAGRTEWPQHWLVLYEDSRAPERHGLLLRIDAASGDVLERELDAPDCPELP